jgi:hypothetical protein
VTSPEPSHSIHVAVVRIVEPFIGGAEIGPGGPVPGDDESTVFWAYEINAAWSLLTFACIVVTGVVALTLQRLGCRDRRPPGRCRA